jgi:hypothetical protein
MPPRATNNPFVATIVLVLDVARRERFRVALIGDLVEARLRVPVVDAEALIGLKLQAVANAPARRAQDEADIRALLGVGRGALRMELIRDYYRLFDREADLDRLLAGLQPG